MRLLPPCLCLAFLVAACGCGKAPEKNEEGKEEIKEEAKEESVLFPEPGAIPGGIADLSGKTGFLVNPGGGIDAVDLETGKVLWHSDAASYPLVIHDDRLYAQEKTDVNPLRVVALNIAAKGKRVMISDPIELLAPPPPKDDLRKDRPSRMVLPGLFRIICAGRMRRGQLYLEWYATGLDAALVDPATGKVTSTRADDPVPAPGPRPRYEDIAKIAADPDALGPRNRLAKAPLKPLEDPRPKELFAIDAAASGPGEDALHFRRRWVAGNVLAVVISRQRHRESDTMLVCWDLTTGKCLHAIRVARSTSASKRRSGTAFSHVADYGRHLLTVSIDDDDDRGKPRPKVYQLWYVETGMESRRLTPPDGRTPPWTAGPRVFYALPGKDGAPPTVQAVDMVKKETLWERPIVVGRRYRD